MSSPQNTERRSRHNGQTRTAVGLRKHDDRNMVNPITVRALVARLREDEKAAEIKAYAERLRAELFEDMAAARQAVA